MHQSITWYLHVYSCDRAIKADVNVGTQVLELVFICSLRKRYTDFHHGNTSLHPHQLCQRFPFPYVPTLCCHLRESIVTIIRSIIIILFYMYVYKFTMCVP